MRGQAGQEHQRRAGSQAQIRHPIPQRALPQRAARRELRRADPGQAGPRAEVRQLGGDRFKILGIRDGVARVQLLGTISSGGSTFTIANEIMPTLKQFGPVRWVKIYDQRGGLVVFTPRFRFVYATVHAPRRGRRRWSP